MLRAMLPLPVLFGVQDSPPPPTLVVDGLAIAAFNNHPAYGERGWVTVERRGSLSADGRRTVGWEGFEAAVYFPIGIGTVGAKNPRWAGLREEESPPGVFLQGAGDDRRVLFGGNGSHPTVPRPVRILSNTNATYRFTLRSFLRRQGLDASPLRLTRLVSTDLDGDGSAEILIEASSRPNLASTGLDGSGVRPTDYSLVLLRTAGKRGVRDLPLWWKKGREASFDVSIRAIADLDEDRRMEIVLGWTAYEANGAELWTFAGAKAKKLAEGSTGV